MPQMQAAWKGRKVELQPFGWAEECGYDEHSTEIFGLRLLKSDILARLSAGRDRPVRTGIRQVGFDIAPLLGTDVVPDGMGWPQTSQEQLAERLSSPDLEEALQELAEVTAYAEEDGLDVPANVAFANADRLLKAMFRISPRRFGVYPMPDGYIAIDARGSNNGIVVVMCGSDGSVLCLVTIAGESRRARYSTASELPDGFIREALAAL